MKVLFYSTILILGLCYLPSVLLAQSELNYRISPSDQVAISVFEEPELSVERSVVASGMITLPLIEQIKIAGKTPREAEIAIARAFKEKQFLKNPQVTVTVTNFAQHTVSVTGFVNKPGKVTMPPGQTRIPLLDAIAAAGDFKNIAKKKKVTIIRKSGSRNGRPEYVNVEDLMKAGRGASLFLYPGDSVFVPQRLF